MANGSTPNFDSDFSDEYGDIILCSTDGIRYKVSSHTLRKTSGFFSAMLSLPQAGITSGDDVTINLDETGKILGTLLRMASGLAIGRWESFDHLESVLQAAEKYDMAGPCSTIRSVITSPHLPPDPLRMYVIAARYEWETEAKIASTLSLTLPIHKSKYIPILERIPSKYLIRLFNLRRQRVMQFRHLLNNCKAFEVGNSDGRLCKLCKHGVDNHPWRDFKAAMVCELERRPIGDTLLDTKMCDWKVAQTCWAATCSNPKCRATLYSKAETLEIIRACVNSLSSTI